MADPWELLQQVKDRESFLAFAAALSAEEARASSTDSSDGLGWAHSSISSFLKAGVACSEAKPELLAAEPTWRGFAQWLWMCKVYE